MYIVQHSVAGEVPIRPHLTPAQAGEYDQQTLDQFACDRSNLPWVIFRAAHRANHIVAIPARARSLLAALARTVDAGRPYAAIFARRELLTGRAMQSMRTFYRSLDDLEAANFITRPPQTRYGGAGLFGRAYLHLTPMAASLLGLVTDERDETHAEAVNPASTLSARPLPNHSLSMPSATLADGPIYKDLIPTSQKRQPRRVPADLERLRALGFRDLLIFKLMREARLHAKKLSDVVEACWDHLKRATHPINYLRSLLGTPVDFAHRVRTVHAAAIERSIDKSLNAEAEATALEYAGRQFESDDGLRTYLVADDASSVTVIHRDETRPRVQAGAWAKTFVNALRTGRIRPMPNVERIEDRQSRSVGQVADLRQDTPIAQHLSGLKQLLRLKQSAPGVAGLSAKEPRRPIQTLYTKFLLAPLSLTHAGAYQNE
ncbi:hypothetical protein BUMB_05718c [Candidatus Paraburkholderia calva]|nr:hypothetical protein BUMB_05718c [Candidatus Paraburkholderia calva]